MREEKIEAVKAWPEPQSIQNIQVFLSFTNFYRRFIKSFSKIAVSFILILKMTAILVSTRPAHIRADENEFSIDSGKGYRWW